MENINPLKFSNRIKRDLLFNFERSLFMFFLITLSLPFSMVGQISFAQQKFDSINSLEDPPSDSILRLELLDISRLAALESNHELNALSKLVYCNFVFDLDNISEYDKAVHIALEFCNDSLNFISDGLRISALNNIAVLDDIKGNYKSANLRYFDALSLDNGKVDNHFDIAGIYSNISSNYINLGDYENAILYAEKAIELAKGYDDQVWLYAQARNLSKKGRALIRKSEYKLANAVLNESISIIENEFLNNSKSQTTLIINTKQRLIESHLQSGSNIKARRMIDDLLLDHKKSNYRIYRTHLLNAKSLLSYQEYDSANEALGLAYKELEQAGTNKYKYSFFQEYYETNGIYYQDIDSLEKALETFHEGLRSIDDRLLEDLASNPSLIKINKFPQASSLLNNKAKTAFTIYQNSGDQYFLDISAKAYLADIELLDKMKTSHLRDGSKYFIAEKANNIYQEAINVLLAKIEIESTRETYDQILSVIDRNKSIILFNAIQNKLNLLASSLPIELIEKENDLRVSISYYEEMISIENSKNTTDTLKINNLESVLFDLRTEYKILEQNIAKEYSEYFDYKNSFDKRTNIDKLQASLEDNELLIEYYQGDSSIYIISISPFDINIKKTNLRQVDSLVVLYRGALSERPNNYADDKMLNKVSLELAQCLLPSIEKTKSLFVVPDGILSNIPFESLVYSIGHKSLFLIETHNICYFFSLNQYLEDRDKIPKTSSTILCLAPEFSEKAETRRSPNPNRQSFLKYAKEEVQFLNSNFKGFFKTSNNTNSSDLLDNIADHSIIHLATHANLNPIDPLLSEVHFNDGSLTTYDIQNLNLQPELVVLSACNTGQGEIQKGEGVFSLSRGFFKAGVKSVQSSLWSIDDYASSEIIKKMYMNLKRGQKKSEALRNAKLDYLSKSDKRRSHPYYWAGIVHIGNDNPLFFSFNYSYILLFLGFGILALGLFFYYKKP